MILECGAHGFVVNAIRVEESSIDTAFEITSPRLIAEFLHEDTVVSVGKESPKSLFEKIKQDSRNNVW